MTDHKRQIEEDKERLEELGREIDAARKSTPEAKAASEPHFIQDGELSDDVDNTIAPPG